MYHTSVCLIQRTNGDISLDVYLPVEYIYIDKLWLCKIMAPIFYEPFFSSSNKFGGSVQHVIRIRAAGARIKTQYTACSFLWYSNLVGQCKMRPDPFYQFINLHSFLFVLPSSMQTNSFSMSKKKNTINRFNELSNFVNGLIIVIGLTMLTLALASCRFLSFLMKKLTCCYCLMRCHHAIRCHHETIPPLRCPCLLSNNWIWPYRPNSQFALADVCAPIDMYWHANESLHAAHQTDLLPCKPRILNKLKIAMKIENWLAKYEVHGVELRVIVMEN